VLRASSVQLSVHRLAQNVLRASTVLLVLLHVQGVLRANLPVLVNRAPPVLPARKLLALAQQSVQRVMRASTALQGLLRAQGVLRASQVALRGLLSAHIVTLAKPVLLMGNHA